MSRTILIGDLHGCYNEAVSLMKKCDVGPTDHVIFLGDFVDRGPDNDKCCDLVRQREQVQGKPAGILGNHEEKHVEYEDCLTRKGRLPEKIAPTHIATRAQLKPEHHAWFKTLPLFIRIPEHNAVALHAGAFPGRPIEAQTSRALLHMQMIRPYKVAEDGTRRELFLNGQRFDKSVWPSRVPDNEDGWAFWTNFWEGPEFVVFGHTVLDRPLLTDKVAGIDGGACFGRQLHALVLDTKTIVTVSAANDYGKGRRGRDVAVSEEEKVRGGIRTFKVHGEVMAFS